MDTIAELRRILGIRPCPNGKRVDWQKAVVWSAIFEPEPMRRIPLVNVFHV